MRAVQISEFGGLDVLKIVELPDPQPAVALCGTAGYAESALAPEPLTL